MFVACGQILDPEKIPLPKPEKTSAMYNSEDLDCFYVEYQIELVPRGMTMSAFCDKNNVPYGVMENFVRNIRKKIVEVAVTGRPSETKSDSPAASASSSPEGPLRKIRKSIPSVSVHFSALPFEK